MFKINLCAFGIIMLFFCSCDLWESKSIVAADYSGMQVRYQTSCGSTRGLHIFGDGTVTVSRYNKEYGIYDKVTVKLSKNEFNNIMGLCSTIPYYCGEYEKPTCFYGCAYRLEWVEAGDIYTVIVDNKALANIPSPLGDIITVLDDMCLKF